jgi:hypothetical protein
MRYILGFDRPAMRGIDDACAGREVSGSSCICSSLSTPPSSLSLSEDEEPEDDVGSSSEGIGSRFWRLSVDVEAVALMLAVDCMTSVDGV